MVTTNENSIAQQALDPDTVKAIVHIDYEILRQIARKPGLSVAAAGAEVDAELDRMTRAHVRGMPPEQARQFIQIYNMEYNFLIMQSFQKKISPRQSLGEVAVKTAVRATVWESVYSLFRLFR